MCSVSILHLPPTPIKKKKRDYLLYQKEIEFYSNPCCLSTFSTLFMRVRCLF